MSLTSTPSLSNTAAKQQRLLDAALAAFLRYGFRKTSMEEVARTAKVSRQLLYLHFTTKEDLFIAVVRHALQTGLDATRTALASNQPFQDKLVHSFFAWSGRYIDKNSCDLAELKVVCEELLGPALIDYEEQFLAMITSAIRARDDSAVTESGITPREIAETLHATAWGLKEKSHSCEEFLTRFRTAVRVICHESETRP